jgi:hypothetical protein
MLRPTSSSSLFRQRWANAFPGESPVYTFVSITPNDGSELGGDPATIVISGFDANNTSDVRFNCEANGDGGDLATITSTTSTTIDVIVPYSTPGSGTSNVVVETMTLERAIGINVFNYNVFIP